jgi:phosphatidylinositol glycan class O
MGDSASGVACLRRCSLSGPSAADDLHHGGFPLLVRELRSSPDRAVLLEQHVDPPTVTMQRLKGMLAGERVVAGWRALALSPMTGTLPTLIEIGANFAAPEFEEDNIINQVG